MAPVHAVGWADYAENQLTAVEPMFKVDKEPPYTPEDFVFSTPRVPAPEEHCHFPVDDVMENKQHIDLSSLVGATLLNPAQQQEAAALLWENSDVFCFTPQQLGRCKLGEFKIDVGDAPPTKQSYFEMPFQKYHQIRQHVQELLALGLARPSNALWSSPVHLVGKKDGTTRMVVAYNMLNAFTRKDAWPLPLIDDILYGLGDAKYFSSIDFFRGYMQWPLHEDSIPLTAFSTPLGLYEYLVVPFEVTNAPSFFCRIMHMCLKDLLHVCCFAYIDDVIVYSKTYEDHKRDLALVFEACEAGLKLNPKYCRLTKSELSWGSE